MRSIYKQLLTSKNLVADALSIRNSITESQCETLKKMQFLVRAQSDASHEEYGAEPVSSAYSVEVMNSVEQIEFFVPSILNWPQLVHFSYSRGFCYIDENTRLMKASGFQYSEVASIKQKQLHRVILKIEAFSEDGIEWYSLYDNEIIEASKRSQFAFRLPWLAQRNTGRLSPVDTGSLTITDIISANDGEVSFQLGDKILESTCPDYVLTHNQRIITCNKGLILRSKRHTLE